MADNRCPHCELPLTAEERSGSTCPSCRQPLDAMRATPTWSSAHERPLPQIERREHVQLAGSLLGWTTVRVGLGLSAFGIFLMVLSVPLMFSATLDGGPPTPMRSAFQSLVGLGMGVGAFLCVTGVLLSVVVPAESEAHAWAILCLIFVLLCSGFSLALMFGSAQNAEVLRRNWGDQRWQANPGRPAGMWDDTLLVSCAYGAGGTAILAVALWMLCLQQIARYLRRSVLAGALSVCLTLYAMMCLTSLVLPFIPPQPQFGPRAEPPVSWIMLVVIGALVLAFWLWFATLVVGVRQAITKALQRQFRLLPPV